MDQKIKSIQDKEIKIHYLDKNIELNDMEQHAINEYWNKVSNLYTRGKIFVVDSINEENNSININLLNSDYAHYIFVRRNPGKAKNCYNLWAGVLLETIDKKYVIGKMSKTTSSAGEYHISGGSCDSDDIERGTVNCEKTMYRELKEEMGLEESDLINVERKYMKNAFFTEQDVGIIYKAIVSKTADELEEYYHNYLTQLKEINGEIEFDKLAYIDKGEAEVKDFCLFNKVPEYTEELLLEDVSEK